MKLAAGIYLTASGNLGVNLGHPLDCNAYAVNCGDEVCLIDAGVGVDSNLIAAQLAADGIQPSRVKRLFLTHGHLDHSGGARYLYDHFQLTVAASPLTAQAVETADEQAIALEAAKSAGVYPPDFPFQSCPVTQVLQPNARLRIGDSIIDAIPTPGHSADMLTFRITQPGRVLLFPGDTFFHGGRIALQNIPDCDIPAYTASLRRVSQLDFDMLFPGHGLWSLSNGYRHIAEAMTFVDRLLLPPNL